MNGAVSQRVDRGLVTSTFQRSASSGFGAAARCCSVPGEQALRGELLRERDDVLLVAAAAEPLATAQSASSAVVRRPSTLSSSAYMSGPSCTICPSARRTSAAPSL